MKKTEQVPTLSTLPLHIAIIMDGNGRWAEKRGLPRKAGHAEGAKTLRKITEHCHKIGIKNVTFYAFSTENWKRPKEEVDALMELFRSYLKDVRKYEKKQVRVMFIGDKSAFPKDMQDEMLSLEADSAKYESMTLLVAVNYGGRDEIVRACTRVSKDVNDGLFKTADINENLFNSYLDTKDVPPVDLLIRPGGEERISNFLIWQCAYAEFYFSPVLWPDFSIKELNKAIEVFQNRNRRFGDISNCSKIT
jgi:undecaprenyl diphosphate synthase